MKILFIGQYRDKGLDGRISRDYLRGLLKSKHDVVARPIYVSGETHAISDEIISAENRYFNSNPDLIIQSLPPDLYEYTTIPSIGIYSIGKIDLNRLVIEKINLLDCFIVTCNKEKEYLEEKSNIPTFAIHPPIEMVDPKTLKGKEVPDLDGSINFYFIDEYTNSSNFDALIQAFHTEFSYKDNVRLLVYCWKENTHYEDTTEIVLEKIQEIKANMRVYQKDKNYLNDLVIKPSLSRAKILELQKQCHCMIIPSKTSIVNYYALDAMMLGNQILCTSGICLESVLKNDADYIDSIDSISNNNSSSKCRSIWKEPNLLDMASKLRAIYNRLSKNSIKNENSHYNVYKNCSYDLITEKLDNVFDKIVNK